MPIFQSKLPITKWDYVSLNSQFNVVLNSIIRFSVQFCDNLLLVLKMRFQVFSLASTKEQGFSSDRKMLMPLQSLFFYLQNRGPWNQPHFQRNSDKSFLSPDQNNLK